MNQNISIVGVRYDNGRLPINDLIPRWDTSTADQHDEYQGCFHRGISITSNVVVNGYSGFTSAHER